MSTYKKSEHTAKLESAIYNLRKTQDQVIAISRQLIGRCQELEEELIELKRTLHSREIEYSHSTAKVFINDLLEIVANPRIEE